MIGDDADQVKNFQAFAADPKPLDLQPVNKDAAVNEQILKQKADAVAAQKALLEK